LSQFWREFVPKMRNSYGFGVISNFSDEVTEERSSVRAEDERVEEGG